jgi:anti-sigma B factor antagonist
MNLSINTDRLDGIAVVHVGGDLDVYTVPRLKEALEGAADSGENLILDLSQVHFIDSTALSVLVTAYQQSQCAGGSFRLVVDDPYLLKILCITGFDGLFPIYSQVNEAVSG